MKNRVLLFVNDTLVDMPERFTFAATIKRLDIGDIAGRSASYTNQLKLPWSSVNQKVFGFLANEKNASTTPYAKLPAKIVANGVEIIPDATCWVTGVDNAGVTISILDNSKNLFSTIQGKKLNRLSHIADSAWLAADMDAARTSTTGLIAAILDWGRNGGGTIYNSSFFLPCFFYYDFIKQILQQTGLTLSGAILTDQTFLDLVIPYGLPKLEYPSSVNSDYVFSVCKNSIDKNIVIAADAGSPSEEVIQIDYDFQNPPTTYQGAARIFDTGAYKATIPNTGATNAWLVATLSASAYFNVSAWNPGDIIRFKIRVRDKNGVVTSTTTADADYATYGAAPVIGLNLIFPSVTLSLKDGDQIDMTVGTLVGSGSGAVTISMRRATSSPFTNLKLSTPSGTVSTASVKWQLLFPDIWQADLLKDFFVRFGIIHNQKGNTLYLKSIKDIIEDVASAVDLTSKRTADPDQINYSPSGWAYANLFTYTEDSGSGIEPDDNAGSGGLYTFNRLLPGERNIYNAMFEVCRDNTVNSVLAALVRVYDSTSANVADFKKEPGLRLLTLRAKGAGEPNITFNAIARSDYKVANFLYASRSKDTSWTYFLNKYYGPVFAKSLKNLRIITRKYNLTELDVHAFDPHKMIYDDGSYFLVSQIKNFIPGTPTQVDLMKIG